MAPQPPLFLVDNVYDRISLYPNTSLSGPAATPGREVFYAVDYRRERTSFLPEAAAAYNGVVSDIGAGNTRAVDALFIDRGHNLWGKTVQVVTRAVDILFGTAGDAIVATLTVPAYGTVGGDPTSATMCVTEEGALYSLFTASSAHRFFKTQVVESWQPIITGLILGARMQMLNFSSVLNEDDGGRTERSQESDAAWMSVDRVYAYRECDISLDLIGSAEYDASIRSLRRALFEKNQPTVIIHNYGLQPARGWMYQYTGRQWQSPMSRVHRKWTGRFREVGPQIR